MRINSKGSIRKEKRYEVFALGLVLVHFLLLVGGLPEVNITADEPAYIAGGYALLKRGTEALAFLSQRGYPPLLAGLEALLLYVADPSIPVTRLDGWPANFDTFTESFAAYVGHWEPVLFTARLPTIVLTILLGVVVYRWASSLWDPKAGLLALGALVFDPSLLAHGRLAHTDVGVVAIGTASLYVVWRWTRTPNWRSALAGGVLLGLTLLSKVSGLFWAVAAMIQLLVMLLHHRQSPHRTQYLLQALLLLGIGLGVFWGGYAFTWGAVRNSYVPVPAPAYWESALYLRDYTTEVFALGRRWYEHIWWYYPVAFLVKNPMLLIAGTIVGGVALIRRGRLPANTLWLFPLLYTGVGLLTGMNIGYRHMLPVHPYLYLIIGGGLGQWFSKGHRWRRWVLSAGCWLYAIGTVRVFPSELSYFNSLVGGPEGGYRYLADSNVDWGQTLPEVVDAYVQMHPGMSTSPPITPFRPSAGQYLISTAHLQGAGISDPLAYEWFRHQDPIDALNYALLVYQVPAVELAWVAQCASPLPPLDAPHVLQGTGVDGLRLIEFDCAQTWVYPAAEHKLGIYALSGDLFSDSRLEFPVLLYGQPTPKDEFVRRHLEGARLSFEKTRPDHLPAFVLYEVDAPPSSLPYSQMWNVASAEQPPVAVRDVGQRQDTTSLDGPLSFLGIHSYPGSDYWEIETWWQVNQGPISRPFSVMAHLTSGDGRALSVADGLGVSPLDLRAGDILVQRHRFARPLEEADCWLRTGIYWLDTMERWHIAGAADADAIFVFLGRGKVTE